MFEEEVVPTLEGDSGGRAVGVSEEQIGRLPELNRAPGAPWKRRIRQWRPRRGLDWEVIVGQKLASGLSEFTHSDPLDSQLDRQPTLDPHQSILI